MTIDLTKEQLLDIMAAFDYMHGHIGLGESEVDTRDYVMENLDTIASIESLDFDECEGGACKL